MKGRFLVRSKKKRKIDQLIPFFQHNAGKAIVIYTIGVFASAYSLVQSQVDSANAIKNQYMVKLDLVEKENNELKSEIKQYRDWLIENEKINPYLYEKFKGMENELYRLNNEINTNSLNNKPKESDKGTDVVNSTEMFIEQRYEVKAGSSFINNVANVMIGVSKVNVTKEAEINVNDYGSGKSEKIKVSSGDSISIKDNKYVILITDVEFLTDTVTFVLKTKGK